MKNEMTRLIIREYAPNDSFSNDDDESNYARALQEEAEQWYGNDFSSVETEVVFQSRYESDWKRIEIDRDGCRSEFEIERDFPDAVWNRYESGSALGEFAFVLCFFAIILAGVHLWVIPLF